MTRFGNNKEEETNTDCNEETRRESIRRRNRTRLKTNMEEETTTRTRLAVKNEDDET